MDEVPDEHLAEILPLAKKIAKALGLIDYNILQARHPSTTASANLSKLTVPITQRTTGRLLSSMSSTSTSIEQQLTTPCLPSVTGIVSGYQFTQGFLATNMARLEAEKARLDKLAAEQDAQNTENTF